MRLRMREDVEIKQLPGEKTSGSSHAMMSRLQVKEISSLLLLGVMFVAVSLFARAHRDILAIIIEKGGLVGVVGFVLLTAVFVIFIIPLDIAFLIPIGANLWGPIPTAFMSITGWVLGASIAFGIARTFGMLVVEKLIGLGRIRAVEKRLPKRNLFLSVIVLRMLVSVDILSYALGLFSSMSWDSYVLATAIGVSPFGFYFAYTSTLPFWYQIIAVATALVLAVTILLRYGIQREP